MRHDELQTDLPPVRAVLFDAYGTLVEIAARRAPFRQLLKIGERQGRPTRPGDAASLMTAPLGLRDAADLLGIRLTADELAQLHNDLHTETASVRAFPEALSTLDGLRAQGFRLGLCSNLAAGYAAPVIALLQGHLDVFVWSFEAGAIKPDTLIYAESCRALGCLPREVLMVGDTLEADVEGPRKYGMYSILLDRTQRFPGRESLASLSGLLQIPGT